MRRRQALLALATATALTAAAAPSTIAGGTARTADLGGRLRSSGIVSVDARLTAGARKTILRVHGLGRWTATCSAGRRAGVSFTADRLLPSTDLVVARTEGAPLARRVDPRQTVTPEPPGDVLAQRWQFAPFAAAQVQVAVANVAARSIDEGDASACSVSVLVATGPDQGPTITG